jgi:hypothetical protein
MDERQEPHERHDAVELPAPTGAPFVMAVGLTLVFAGIVTHPAVSVTGLLLAVVGAVGWWRQVLPVERHERFALVPTRHRAEPVPPAAEAGEPLEAGAGGHRLRLPVEVPPFRVGVPAGVGGGAAMAVVACAFGVLSVRSPWYPINLLSAVILPSLGSADLARLREFSLAGLLVGIGLHGSLSVFVGLLYAAILPMLPNRPILWGGLVAPLLWSSVVWASLGIVDPTLNARISWPWFVVSQIAFGVGAGLVVARSERVPTRQSPSLAERADLDSARRDRGSGDGKAES